jgi:hypothetical protein
MIYTCQVKPLEQSIYTLKNEGQQEGKTGPVWGWVLVGGEG